MEMQAVPRKGAIELIPKGKLDINQAESFEELVREKTDKADVRILGMNMIKIEYIDSSGLGALIKVLNLCKNSGKTLYLFGAAPKIQNIFELARLEKFFNFLTPVEFKSKYPSADDQEIDDLISKL